MPFQELLRVKFVEGSEIVGETERSHGVGWLISNYSRCWVQRSPPEYVGL